ncbi:hypothetical protein [Enterococcus olivae]
MQWGIPADRYWDLTYLEIIAQVEANKNRYELEMKNRAMFDYNSAQLNAYAFNTPNKMPKIYEMYPFLEEERKQVSNSFEDNEEFNESLDQQLLLQQLTGVANHLRKAGGKDGTGKTGDNH